MSYEFLKHTADVRMKVRSKNLRGLFCDAVVGLMDFIYGKNLEIDGGVKRKIMISSPDPTALLVDFLNEILAQSQINKEVYPRPVFKKFSDTELEAELNGISVPAFKEDVKAVTYHEAEIKQITNGLWEVVLVFDI